MDLLIEFGPLALAVIGAIAAAVMWKQLDHDQRCWAVFGIMTALLVWAYMNSMEKVSLAWKSPQYSHGYLIPPFAAFLLFTRRQSFLKNVPVWHQGIGLGIVIVATLIRVFSSQMAIMTVDRLMILPSILGIMMIVGGLRALMWSAAPIMFLIFMFPLPRFAERAVLNPLQSVATRISHYALETLGVECFTQGNRIMLDGVEMGVVDACSGLRMATIFGALCAAIALIATNRPWWERLIIFCSSLPIALAVNSIRITVTGLAYSWIGTEGEMYQIINAFAHDFAGWIMMPMALGLLYLEYQILARIVIEEEEQTLSPMGGLG